MLTMLSTLVATQADSPTVACPAVGAGFCSQNSLSSCPAENATRPAIFSMPAALDSSPACSSEPAFVPAMGSYYSHLLKNHSGFFESASGFGRAGCLVLSSAARGERRLVPPRGCGSAIVTPFHQKTTQGSRGNSAPSLLDILRNPYNICEILQY